MERFSVISTAVRIIRRFLHRRRNGIRLCRIMAALSLIIIALIATSMASVSAESSSDSNRGGMFNPFQFVQSFPWSNFPSFTNFGEEIKNTKPAPGGTFSGVAVSSSSNSYRDKDGKLVNTGGSTVVTNHNGVVKEYKTGDNPPDGLNSKSSTIIYTNMISMNPTNDVLKLFSAKVVMSWKSI